MGKELRLRLVVSPVPVDSSAEDAPSTLFAWFREFVSSYAVSLSSVFSGGTVTSKYVIALAHKLNVPRVAARRVITHNMIEYDTPIVRGEITYEFLVHKAVYLIGPTSIVKSPIASVGGSMPYPAIGMLGNCYLAKQPREFALCKHTNIIHKEGL